MKRLFYTLIIIAIAVIIVIFGNKEIKESQQKRIALAVIKHYENGKPWTRWWWFATVLKKEDISKQLEWVKTNNFGGVEVAFVYPYNARNFINGKRDTSYIPRQPYLSKEWSKMVVYAKHYADSIGVGMDFTFGTGWPFGGTFVKREDATTNYGEKNDSNKWSYITVSWEYPKKGYIVNHMDEGAMNRYSEHMGNALSHAMKGTNSSLFCDSWEVETHNIWTNGFDKTFKKEFGYDIIPYMKNIYADNVKDERYDYMKHVSDYVINQFYVPFTNISNNLSGFSRVQCSGAPVDILNAYAAADVPEGEAMLYEPYFSRIPASAAMLSGKKVISSETFTCAYGFPKRDKKTRMVIDNKHLGKEITSDLKMVADALFANGINQIFWHGMPYNGVNCDTNMFYATVHAGSKGTLSIDIPKFNLYMQKVSENMKRGKTYSDIAIYIPNEDSWVNGECKVKDSIMDWAWGEYEMRYIRTPEDLKGYNPMWINAGFLKNSSFDKGTLICGDANFKALYVDVNYMDENGLKAILKLAKKGLPVCLKKNPIQAGRNKSAEFTKMLADLKTLENVSTDLKKVFKGKPLIEADKDVDYYVRNDTGTYYIFFPNPKIHSIKFPLRYGQSYQKENITRKVKININGITKSLNLVFKPYQSLLYKIDKKGNITPVDIYYLPKRVPIVKEKKKEKDDKKEIKDKKEENNTPIDVLEFEEPIEN